MTQMALVIDLNVCVGCHACVTSCKEWNTSGESGSLADFNPYDADPSGTFFNRVQTFEAGTFPDTETIHFPKSCLHCEDPPCVPVCPTGASFKRKEDGLVLVDYDKCIGCKYCAWACPYGAREIDEKRQEMTKCTLCVDRINNEELPERDRKPACVMACPTSARLFGDIHDPDSIVSKAIVERDGYQLMPEWGTKPSNHYLPRRKSGTPARDDGGMDARVAPNGAFQARPGPTRAAASNTMHAVGGATASSAAQGCGGGASDAAHACHCKPQSSAPAGGGAYEPDKFNLIALARQFFTR